MPESTNYLRQVRAAEQISEATGRLLAAEAEWLTAWGWTPWVVQKADPMLEQVGVVKWSKDNGTKHSQCEAVRIQKATDPVFSIQAML